MRIPFKMPVELPADALVSFSVVTGWKLDINRKMAECFSLEIEIPGSRRRGRDARKIFKAISEANKDIFSSSFRDERSPDGHEYKMQFAKRGASAEQDPNDTSIIIWPPDDPIEWAN